MLYCRCLYGSESKARSSCVPRDLVVLGAGFVPVCLFVFFSYRTVHIWLLFAKPYQVGVLKLVLAPLSI